MTLFRYFMTFLDVLMCLCIFLFARSKNDKASLIGFSTMFIAYACSAFLIWN